jgi:Phospholipase B
MQSAFLFSALACSAMAMPRDFSDAKKLIPRAEDNVQHPVPGFLYVYKDSQTDALGSKAPAASWRVSAYDISKPAVAWGNYSNTIMTNGWSRLEVHTNASYSSADQAFAAGYFEGIQFPELVWYTVINQGLNSSLPSVTQKWLDNNAIFMNASIEAYANSDPYWYHISLLLEQQLGIFNGYRVSAKPGQQLTLEEIMLINQVADLGDLLPSTVVQHLNKISREQGLRAAREAEAAIDEEIRQIQRGIPRHSTMGAILETKKRVVLSDSGSQLYELAPMHIASPISLKLQHCSALIRMNSDASEIFLGHASWAGAETMLRTWKIYDFPWTQLPQASGLAAGRISSFSGYPGQIPSLDDFIVKSSGLVLTETTIGNNNATLSELYTVPTTVLDWMRGIVASRLAFDGPSWAQLFSRYNSGTVSLLVALAPSCGSVQPCSSLLFSFFLCLSSTCSTTPSGWCSTTTSSLLATTLSSPTLCGSWTKSQATWA